MNDYDTRANQELLLSFFLTFSRFEYALKVSGFFKKPNETRYDSRRPPAAEPDWDKFAVSLREVFSKDRAKSIKDACEYLLDCPPNKQVIIRDNLEWEIAWETPIRQEYKTDIEFTLRMVRCIRNNLFHGGKHGIEVHEDTDRTEHLLNSCIVVLKECLTLVPQVGQCFDEATI